MDNIVKNKKSEDHMDSVDTQNESPENHFISFNLKNLSGSRFERVDQCTNTDEPVCNCSCDEIPKLKEKAHKSFMQVIQIQNLYKEQIQQLKDYYEERQKKKDKQYRYKEELLNDKCSELEAELRGYRERDCLEKVHRIEIQTNPFTVDNIQAICCTSVDSSNQESLYNIREFMCQKNFDDFKTSLKNQLFNVLQQVKQNLDNDSAVTHLLESALKTTRNIFSLIKDLKEENTNAQQKYNEQYCLFIESETKYQKLSTSHESLQKENKFMTEQIKRISSEKIKMQQKYNQCQRLNKTLEENIKQIKKIAQEKGVILPYPFRKEKQMQDDQSSDSDCNISGQTLKTIVSSKGKKSSPVMRLNKPAQKPQLGQFRKRNPLFSKK